jgi:hypothetical protein
MPRTFVPGRNAGTRDDDTEVRRRAEHLPRTSPRSQDPCTGDGETSRRRPRVSSRKYTLWGAADTVGYGNALIRPS